MATSTITYSAATTITISPASLGSSTTFVAGRESTEVDNTTNKYIDVLVQGFVTSGTSPTVDKTLRLYVWGSHTSLGTTALDVLDGTDSAETFTSTEIHKSITTLVKALAINATSSQKYHFKPFSLAHIFGQVPQYWGLYLSHDTGVNLHSTAGNHEFKYTGIKFDNT